MKSTLYLCIFLFSACCTQQGGAVQKLSEKIVQRLARQASRYSVPNVHAGVGAYNTRVAAANSNSGAVVGFGATNGFQYSNNNNNNNHLKAIAARPLPSGGAFNFAAVAPNIRGRPTFTSNFAAGPKQAVYSGPRPQQQSVVGGGGVYRGPAAIGRPAAF